MTAAIGTSQVASKLPVTRSPSADGTGGTVNNACEARPAWWGAPVIDRKIGLLRDLGERGCPRSRKAVIYTGRNVLGAPSRRLATSWA